MTREGEPQEDVPESLPAQVRRAVRELGEKVWRRREWLAPLPAVLVNLLFVGLVTPLVRVADTGGWSFLYALPVMGVTIAQPLLAAFWAVGAPHAAVYRWPAAVAVCVLQAIVGAAAIGQRSQALVFLGGLFSAYVLTLSVWRWLRPWRLVLAGPEQRPVAEPSNRFGLRYPLLLMTIAAALIAVGRLALGGLRDDWLPGSAMVIAGQIVGFTVLYGLVFAPAAYGFSLVLRRTWPALKSIIALPLAIPLSAACGALVFHWIQPAASFWDMYPQVGALSVGPVLSLAVSAVMLRLGGYRLVHAQAPAAADSAESSHALP